MQQISRNLGIPYQILLTLELKRDNNGHVQRIP